MPKKPRKSTAFLHAVLRVSCILTLCIGVAAVLGQARQQVMAAGPQGDGPQYVAGVLSSAISCLSAGTARMPVDGKDACPSAGIVALRWSGEPSRARLVLRTSGAHAPHSILVNGQFAVKAPLAVDSGSAHLLETEETLYLTIPVELVIQGENRIEFTTDASQTDPSIGDASVDDGWQATDVRIELFGRMDQKGLAVLPLSPDVDALVRTGDASLAAVRSIVAFANTYDGTRQEAAIQVPDGYQSAQATPLVVYVHGRGGVMSTGIDQLGDAANAKGWLLASPQLHGHWIVPQECYVYPNDCTYDDKMLAGTTSPDAEPRPGAFAYASVESQYDIVGTVRYMIEHYNVKLDQIYLYGVSMGGQTAAVVQAKYPHLFAATLETMGPTDAGPWHDEQIDVEGLHSPSLRAMRKECNVGGVPQYPGENPFCYQQRSGLYFARNYVVEPGARPPISITHSTADILVPVHHARDFRDAINGFGPAQPVVIYEDQVVGPTCPPTFHCYAPDPMASLGYYEAHRLDNSPVHIRVASDQSKSYYWLNLLQSGNAHWSYVEANAQVALSSLTIETQDSAPLTLGLNLGTTPIAVPEVGNAVLQPGLGFPVTTYLVRGSAADGLYDYASGYLNVTLGPGLSTVTVSAIDPVLSALPETVVADPQGTTEVVVQVRDRLGHGVPDGTEVLLETSWGVFANGSTAYIVNTTGGLATATLTLEPGRDSAQVTATCRSVAKTVEVAIETVPGSHTPTPTATATETPTLAPTPTPVPEAGVVVDIRHETDLSEYAQLIGGGDLSQSASAAQAGTAGGMAVSIDDLAARYGEARFAPLAAEAYRYRFYLDPNGLQMVDWKNFIIARTRSDGTARQWVVLRYSSGRHELRLAVRDDNGAVRYTGYHGISDGSHYVELLVRHAATGSASDGLVALSIDGLQVDQVGSLDIYDADKRPNNLQVGAVSGLDAGTLGTFYLDEILLREGEAEIGPVTGGPGPEPTSTLTPTPTPTFTETPDEGPTMTPTPTETLTATPTDVPGSAVTVDIRHETDLGGYDRLVGGTDLMHSAAAALAGTSGGLAAVINGIAALYGEVTFPPLTAPAYRYRFYLDPNGLQIGDWKSFIVARVRSGWTARQWIVLLGRSGGHELRLAVRDDSGTMHYSGYHAITDAEHYVEVLVRHAAGTGAADGLVTLSIDGTQVDQISGLDNHELGNRPDNLQLGAVWGIDAGTLGTFYMDELILAQSETEIGPVNAGPAPAPTPTFVQTPTPTPTPTATPTAIATPTGSAAIVQARHEKDLSEYTRLVGGGALSSSSSAALAGTAGGLAVSIQDQTPRYAEAQFSPLTAPAFRARFYVDPNGLEMADWRNFIIARTLSGGTARQWVVLRQHGGVYELRLVVRDDGGTAHYSGYYVISDAEHYVEILVRHASGAASADGEVVLSVDGVQAAQIGSLDAYDTDKRPDRWQWGAVTGIDAGTLGTLYLDELVLREGEPEIGPLAR